MQIICPDCESRVPLYAVDLQHGTATCPSCGALFDCTNALPARLVQHTPVVLPKGTTVELFERAASSIDPYRSSTPELGALRIRRRWNASASTTALALRSVLTLAWWCALPFWWSMLDDRLAPGLAFYGVAVGVGLSYSLLGDLLNSSTITADAHMLVVRHGPISMRRTMRLRVREIARIGCRQVMSNTTRNGEPVLTYSVCARFHDGRRIDLLDGLPEAEPTRFISQQLAGHLQLARTHADS
jgi:hypothetical protein